MKKIVNIILVTIAITTLTSCYDILDQTPTDRYTDDQVWNDSYLLESHLAELYCMTTVMINDANCLFDSSPLNVDNSSWNYLLGMSPMGEGATHAIEAADEAKYNFGAQANLNGLKLYGLQPNDTQWEWWGNAYYLNRQLNFFIEHIAESQLSEAQERLAEARFLRAYNYFALVKRYGGVPLITKVAPINADESELYPARNTEKEIYDFIIKETQEIAETLDSKPEAGRASKWAALTLCSRAALYAGSIAQFGTQQLNGLLGFPSSDAQSYYQIAYDAAKKIIDGGQFALYEGNPDKVQNLKDIFLVKGNCEAIMVKQHTGAGLDNGGYNVWSWDMCECPRPNVWGVGNYHCPYLDFVEKFDYIDGKSGKLDKTTVESKPWTMDELWGNKDPRFHAFIWTLGSKWRDAIGGILGENTINLFNGIKLADGTVYDTYGGSYEGLIPYGDQITRFKELSNKNTGFGVFKYLDPNANNMQWFGYSYTDYQIFRYAEVLLNFAEAAFELGKTAEATDAINQIRERAGVADITTVTRENIRNERAVELCFENHRYWDLRRWRVAAETLTTSHTGITYQLDWDSYKAGTPRFWIKIENDMDGASTRPTFPENNYYFPIGKGRIASNPNLVENPGY